MKHWYLVFLPLWLSLITTPAFAEEPVQPSMWENAKSSLAQTWQSKDYELYIPIGMWHNRNYYTAEKIDSYNERPWGLGVGKYRYDDDGDWQAVYVMVFQDSYNKTEPIAGYAYQKIWRPAADYRLGLGYTVGLTMRQDMNYIPIPVLAPLFSVDYKKLALQSTYIPGGEGNGNVLFTWLRWQLQ